MQSEPSFERFKLMATIWGIYCRASKGGGWLSYHFFQFPATPFGMDLLEALAVCEEKLRGLGVKLAKELAAVKFERKSERSYEQFIQKLAEIAALRALVEAPWPEGTIFQHEPKAPNGKRPELSVETEDALYLFEVKCAAMIEHQKTRQSNPGQFPARTLPKEAVPGMAQAFEGRVTLPRDYPMAEFLMSANEKFSSFQSEKPIFGALIVVWDNFMYEGISPLTHEMSGLLTPQSWKKGADGERIPFSAVDGVMLLNHFNVLTGGLRKQAHSTAPTPSRSATNNLSPTFGARIWAASCRRMLSWRRSTPCPSRRWKVRPITKRWTWSCG